MQKLKTFRRAAAILILAAGALVEVIAPWACEDLVSLVTDPRVQWRRREYVAGDLLEPSGVARAHGHRRPRHRRPGGP